MPKIGLSSKEAHSRLKEFGLNEVRVNKRAHVLVELLKNFANPLIVVLILVAIVSLILGDHVNGIIVMIMVICSVCLNFYQEHKATLAAQKLQEKVALMARVIRDGVEIKVRASHVCVGDVLVLEPGDMVCADADIFESKDLYVNQAAITGESFPVEKSLLGDKTLFSGASVVTGSARAIVTAIGVDSEMGKVTSRLGEVGEENSFTKGIGDFSSFILRIILVFVLVIFCINALLKQDILQSLTFAIAVAVGLTPEFLPMIMGVTMAKGASLMAKKGVIVKKLSAIPTFGSMNILCTDKTGTITQDKIELVKCVDYQGEDSAHVFEMAFLNSSLQSGMANPLDKAIIDHKKLDISAYKKLDELPFDFERRRMSVVVEKNGTGIIITKGAPEFMLTQAKFLIRNGKQISLDSRAKNIFLDQYKELSSRGYRVLAIASKKIAVGKKTYSNGDEVELVLAGFTAFLDPVKADAKKAIDSLESIGIEVKVVTGDNELVTVRACQEADIKVKGVLLGSQIAKMSQQELQLKAGATTIFARVSPTEKESVILALKRAGNVVGYMGDGINDALSLNAADIGISVDNAVDVAKESADFILTNKSLMQLKEGVIEGRVIFGNTMKYIMMGLSSNYGNMFSVLGAVLFLPFLPMLPIQILLNNFLYDFSQLAIPTDKVDEEYLVSPKKWDLGFIRRFMMIFGPISSIFDFLTFFVLYKSFSSQPHLFQTGWFMESLASQVLAIYIIRTRKIPFIQSSPSRALLISTVAMVGVGWLLPYTRLAAYFSLHSVPLGIGISLAGIVLAYLISLEIGKRLFYRLAYKLE